jgi:hypothetical protein
MLNKFKEAQQENAYYLKTLAILKNFWKNLLILPSSCQEMDLSEKIMEKHFFS